MRNKRKVHQTSDFVLRKLRIVKKKSSEQLRQEFTNRQFLKLVPGGENLYIAGDGNVRLKQNPAIPKAGTEQFKHQQNSQQNNYYYQNNPHTGPPSAKPFASLSQNLTQQPFAHCSAGTGWNRGRR